MPEEPVSIFISYSRTDSEFVDRLEADLQARNFRTWVDRHKLEGGQIWLDEIEKSIEQCQVLLVVLSPASVTSQYVRMEYRYARSLDRLVIPLLYRPCPRVPIDLSSLQRVNFESAYEQGLKELLITLCPIKPITIKTPQHLPAQITRDVAQLNLKAEESDLVAPQPASPPPDPDLNNLYRAGVTARAEGDLERLAILWQQILDRDPNFENGTLAPRMKRLEQELHPTRVQRWQGMAEQAHRAGEWRQEIGAWQALLGLEPKATQAKERISVAEHNQKYALDYENAHRFVREGQISAAKTQLEMLYDDAPYYGDPAGLANSVGVQVPASYQAQKAQAQKAAEKRKEFLAGTIGAFLGNLIRQYRSNEDRGNSDMTE